MPCDNNSQYGFGLCISRHHMTVNLRRHRHVSYILKIIMVDFVTLSHDHQNYVIGT